jgi:hypothetical protein
MSADTARRARDTRLDFFRGLTMFIIFIAHIPENPWNSWIPARFGWSSGAELFVFCSGLASSLAFGSIFVKHGYWAGLKRIIYRIWQIYWAHIGLFLAIVSITLAASEISDIDYVEKLFLNWFFEDPRKALPAFLTLRFIPNLLDILPMYIVVLAAVPLVMALARIHPALVALVSIGLWLMVQITGINLPARAGQDFGWYFNPMAWQMLFFTGFAFGMGWLPYPRLQQGLLFKACVAFIVLSIPLTFWWALEVVPLLETINTWLMPDHQPTSLHWLRYVHLLALAYVALTLIEPRRHVLDTAIARPILTVGRQSLATFLASMAMAWTAGIMLDWAGRSMLNVSLVNTFGLLGVYAIARIVTAMKAKPRSSGQLSPKAAPEQPDEKP